MSDNNSNNNDVLFTEAPASWNTRYISPDGFECQLTLRCEKGTEILAKAEAAIASLLNAGAIPYTYRGRNHRALEAQDDVTENNGNGNGSSIVKSPTFCYIHQVEMKRWSKDGRTWHSHKIEGGWCNGQ